MNTHLFGVVPASLATLAIVIATRRTAALNASFRNLAKLAGFLLLLQIMLGIATFHLRLQVELLTVSHQAIGASLLGTLVCFTVLAWRDRYLSNLAPEGADS